ncbi:hypothetical protein ACJMK2_028541 [Sinanodonta woodiana]|uniref:Uncharacterized protein n=1 Tax=Sinanodonta woodiana TaxID=1069815 RepID=A0ABD3XB05_SINWO
MIPLRPLYGAGHTEPAFIQKRNKRERDRVRYVNERYAKLLPDSKIENLETYSKDNEINKEMCQSSDDKPKEIQPNITRAIYCIKTPEKDVDYQV